MGNLFQPQTRRRFTLDGRTLIGRSRKCDLQLSHPSISGEHAVLWWADGGWWLRDLGSRNGTFVDGAPLSAEQPTALPAGAELAFGHHPITWTLESAAEPLPRAVALSGAEVSVGDGLLALPSAEQPVALIYRDPHHGWLVEDSDAVRPVRDLELLPVAGDTWRLHLPDVLPRTVDLQQTASPVNTLTLSFTVSADEEHVTLSARDAHREHDLGSRAHHYMLLTLARARLNDAQDPDLSESMRGWLYQDELADMLRLSRARLNLLIFRARKQFAALGVEDAREIVERRLDSKQIRIGTGDLVVRSA